MNERMTDAAHDEAEELACCLTFKDREPCGCGEVSGAKTIHAEHCPVYAQETALDSLLGELDRARSEEARLLEENRKKDATIKALADALWSASPRILRDGSPCWCGSSGGIPHADSCETKRAALRLVGR